MTNPVKRPRAQSGLAPALGDIRPQTQLTPVAKHACGTGALRMRRRFVATRATTTPSMPIQPDPALR
eukprot:11213192-Lingulodinium_polyedra.AAC.1